MWYVLLHVSNFFCYHFNNCYFFHDRLISCAILMCKNVFAQFHESPIFVKKCTEKPRKIAIFGSLLQNKIKIGNGAEMSGAKTARRPVVWRKNVGAQSLAPKWASP